MAIQFFDEDSGFKLKDKNLHKKWLKEIATKEGYQIGELTYIFCTDEYLFNINVEYLNHDTYTDIITFDNSEDEEMIEGDIFISIDRVKENAIKEDIEFYKELHRVMSHGVLHLMGYKDKSKEDIKLMREMEDQSISLYENI
ncbi:rRNA maturation RNase YbeY [Belliella aquatica]|uniref:Endoribonuclease YbeY n=1 Tax=Belliella aquatica TaxID=1323734 RepID=A0ABQ1LMW1_9BACT|nr:rRNA maturation RNase YbeY [Belliella aquatica]MCH7404286.1 rRNA maturation RNase YbeY [Belliella aquatica]GGC26842.1 endoribonuclease YbeY [Belliella aquatica]